MIIFNGGKQTANWARTITNKVYASSSVLYTEREKFKHFSVSLNFVDEELHAFVRVMVYNSNLDIATGAQSPIVFISNESYLNALPIIEQQDCEIVSLDAGSIIDGGFVCAVLTPRKIHGEEKYELTVKVSANIEGVALAILKSSEETSGFTQLTYNVIPKQELAYRQWECSIVDGSLRVNSGTLSWGGGNNIVWPSGNAVSTDVYSTLPLPDSGTKYVIWFTKHAPCPVTYCPKNPTQKGECPSPDGKPNSWSADVGEVTLVDSLSRETGWTDFHIIATVSKSEDSYIVNQIQTAEISVNAIVRADEDPGGEDPGGEDPEDKECSDAGGADFPSSVDDEEGFGGEDDNSGGGPGENEDDKFPSKVDVCW